MIGKIFEKRDVKALFRYVKKDDSQFIGGNLLMDNEVDFLNNFLMYQGSKKITKPAVHVVLSAHRSDGRINDEQWLEAVEIYLKEMGFDTTNHGWSVVRHSDTKNDHVHIIISKTNMDGQTWKNTFSKYRNVAAVAKVEERLDLLNKQSTKQVQKNKDQMRNPLLILLKPSPDSIRHVKKRNNDIDFFKEIQDKADEIVTYNRNITLSQFRALLVQKNIALDVMTDAKNEVIKGLTFSQIDLLTGEKHSFKASTLGSKFLWKNLSSRQGFINDLNHNPIQNTSPIITKPIDRKPTI